MKQVWGCKPQPETRRALKCAKYSVVKRVVFTVGKTVLGSLLTTARKEAEARELLLDYLPLAERNDSAEEVGWFLLAPATADQYLGLREEANGQFSEVLSRARHYRWSRLEHFVLHHWGRLLVEEGRLVEARECFVEALRLRELMNEPFQASTREALADLDEIEGESGDLPEHND